MCAEIVLLSSACSWIPTAGFAAGQPRVPKGIYNNFVIEATINQAQVGVSHDEGPW